MSDLSQRLAQLTPEKRALLEKRLQEKAEEKKRLVPEPLAIIGMGCRFPGGANCPEAFWQLLKNGVDAITEVPRERWDLDAYYDPDPETPRKMSTRWGGFLRNIEQFDPHFFNISPREAAQMDPQQRMLLETAWEALEAAGQTLEGLRGSATGVFVGIHSYSSEYGWKQLSDLDDLSIYTATGTNHSIMPNRISYWLDLRGPSLALDTACSSSLVAVHLACQSLRAGECRMALAGGANLILSPEATVAFSKMNMMSADGRCKAFDAAADGFVRSEGVGMIVIKRLSDALANNDPILALIRGSAVNQDGATNGITAPNSLSQIDVVRAALQNAEVPPEEITYVETHGTGTILGDPIEVEALAAAIGQPRENGAACVLGSVKTNIGHLEGAAGIAGLIKTVLCLQHGEIPPHLHFKKLNPHISLANTRFEIHPNGCAWPGGVKRRIAGVSSFGFGGTNAHVVISDRLSVVSDQLSVNSNQSTDHDQLLPLSARTPEALQALAESYEKYFLQTTNSLHDIFFTASARRTHHEHRLAVVAHSREDAQNKLKKFIEEEENAGVVAASYKPRERQPALAFVFSGQGPNWYGIGRELLQKEKVFREQMLRCDAILQELAGWSLLEELQHEETSSRLEETEIAQPAYCGMQISLAALWQSWGLVPEAVIGHSLGEIAAAHVAGALTLEEVLRIAYHRGRLLQQEAARLRGGMAAVELSPEEAHKLLLDYEDRVAIASINSPNAVVLSGERPALEELAQILMQREVSCRMLNVKFASHSPHMEPYRLALTQQLRGLQPRAARLPMYSTVTAQEIAGEVLTAEYWGRNLRATVRFTETLEKLLANDFGAFIEISPHPVLSNALTQCARSQDAVVVSSLRRGQAERETMLNSLATLYVNGYEPNWRALYPFGKVAALPSYPWQRKKYWVEERGSKMVDRGSLSAKDASRSTIHNLISTIYNHPLLGARLQTPLPIFETQLSFAAQPFLAEHRIEGAGLVPAAIHLEMLLAASRELFGEGEHLVQAMAIHEALVLPETESVAVQIVFTPREEHSYSFQTFSAGRANGDDALHWRLHAAGVIVRATGASVTIAEKFSTEALRRACDRRQEGEAFYEHLRARGLQFGPKFRGIQMLWIKPEEALAQIVLPRELHGEISQYRFHPALLDACLQTLAALLPSSETNADPVLMVQVGAFRWHRPPSHELWSHAALRAVQENFHGEVRIYNTAHELVAVAENLLLKRMPRAHLRVAQEDETASWRYNLVWHSQPLHRDFATGTSPKIEPLKIITQLQERVTVLSERQDLAQFRELAPHLEELSCAYVLRALRQLGCELQAGDFFTHDSFCEHFGVIPAQRRLLQRMLDVLMEDGLLAATRNERGDCVYHATNSAPAAVSLTLHALLQRFPACEIELNLLHRCGERLAEILCGRCEPLHLLFSDEKQFSAERLYRDSAFGNAANMLVSEAVAAALQQMPQDRTLRILEIGAGTGGTTTFILSQLPANRIEYVFTDVSRLLLAEAEEKFRTYSCMRYRLLDIEKEPAAQGFEAQSFDLIIAANVLHATADLRRILQHVRGLLSPRGALVLLEGTSPQRWIDLTFGMTEGWWKFSDYELRPLHPLLASQKWCALLEECGFEHAVALAEDEEHGLFKQTIVLARNAAQSSGTWLLLADQTEVSRALAQQLTKYGARCFVVNAGEDYERLDEHQFKINPSRREDYERLLRETPDDLRGIVHLGNLEERDGEITTAAQLEAQQLRDCGSMLHLAQAVTSAKREHVPKLWIITRNAQPVGDSSQRIAYEQSTLWGMGRVIALEHPEMWGGMIDLDADFAAEIAADKLAREIFQANEEDQIAWRGEQRFVARLENLVDRRSKIVDSASRSTIHDPQSSILITGGLGGLGLLLAQWFAEQGAPHLVLMGRRGLPERAQWDHLPKESTAHAQVRAIRAIEAHGATVVTFAADVSDMAQMTALFHEFGKPLPRLQGVVHAAAVIELRALRDMQLADLQTTLRSKLTGAWVLHELTKALSLDFFVMFSSTTALLGAHGLAHYAAANQGLDALAHHRRAIGLPALSINWGLWERMRGFSAQEQEEAQRFGLIPMSAEKALTQLARLLHSDEAQVMIADIDWRKLKSAYEAKRRRPFLDTVTNIKKAVKKEHAPQKLDILAQLQNAAVEQRYDMLRDFIHAQAAKVLGMAAPHELEAERGFFELGMDSLTSVELRRRLEKSFAEQLPSTLTFNYPNVAALTKYVATRLLRWEDSTPKANGVSVQPKEGNEAADADEDYSEEELEAMLAERLQRVA